MPLPKRRPSIAEDRYFPYALVLPSVLLIAVFIFFPMIRVFSLAFQNYSYNEPSMMNTFAGLSNFRKIIASDRVFWASLPISFIWVVSEIGLQLVFGMAVALLMNRKFRWRGAVRAIVFIPWAVSGVLTTMLWTLLLNQHIGLLNDLFVRIGLIRQPIAWLSNVRTVFPAVVAAELWRGVPFFAITLLAGLQGIPKEVYESAQIDGAGRTRTFFSVTLSFLKETIVFTTLLRTIWEFNSIDMIFTMTNGGPARMTTTLPIYVMQASIVEGDYGYGSALAAIAFCILLVFAVLYMRVTRYGGSIDD